MCFYIAVLLWAINSTNTLIKVHKNMHMFAEVLFEKTRLKNNLSIHQYGNVIAIIAYYLLSAQLLEE